MFLSCSPHSRCCLPSPTVKDSGGRPALFHCLHTTGRHAKCLSFLLECGADPNTRVSVKILLCLMFLSLPSLPSPHSPPAIFPFPPQSQSSLSFPVLLPSFLLSLHSPLIPPFPSHSFSPFFSCRSPSPSSLTLFVPPLSPHLPSSFPLFCTPSPLPFLTPSSSSPLTPPLAPSPPHPCSPLRLHFLNGLILLVVPLSSGFLLSLSLTPPS